MPKKQGGHRLLGVPTVSDRIGQMVVKLVFEPDVEPIFHADSYGYRSGKSALDALTHCRTEAEARALLAGLKLRFEECKLELQTGVAKDAYPPLSLCI